MSFKSNPNGFWACRYKRYCFAVSSNIASSKQHDPTTPSTSRIVNGLFRLNNADTFHAIHIVSINILTNP